MKQYSENFGFSVVEDAPQKQIATVIIGKEYVHALYNEALQSQKKLAKTLGFSKGETPMHYIEQNFRPTILEHLKELLFTHCVVHLLYDSLSAKKIVMVGDPDLVDIKLQPEKNAEFIFKLSNVSFDREERWKKLRLKPLARKKYKDLDRQVENFIKDELGFKEKATGEEIGPDDWVNFDVSLIDTEKHDLIPGYTSNLWIQLKDGEDDKDLQDLLLGKKVGDKFHTTNVFLQEYISPASDIQYGFCVTIKKRLPGSYFSLDLLKRQFNIEDEEIPAKLIEVFSTRNDITLRRETIEAVLKLLSKQYHFTMPKHLLEQQRKMVLQGVQNNPDYLVYKSRPDFKEKVNALAEKQLKEAIIVDAIGYQKGITVDSDDILAYLNLLIRPRVKNFMYFRVPEASLHGHAVPLSNALIKRYCFREKTLNNLIREITQKPKA